MCGIVGYIGKRQAAPILLEGLYRLEYRGYDSAGIAIGNKGKLRIAKRKGKVRELDALEPHKFRGVQGIAHTRWATHGEPSDRNAHPHSDASGRYAVVHNGIVENAAALKAQLAARGCVFTSDTDTEVLAHLIALLDDGSPLETVVAEALRRVVGAYGVAVIDAERPDTLVVKRTSRLASNEEVRVRLLAGVLTVPWSSGQGASPTRRRSVVRFHPGLLEQGPQVLSDR